MVISKSNKLHWENVMRFDNSLMDNYIKSFLKTEQFALFNLYIPNWDNKHTFFEVWAAPGLYGMVFRKYFNYVVWWIEYTDNWYESIKHFFQNKQEDYSHFIKWDFFNFNGNQSDIVFSWWFVEHFDNYVDVIDRHIQITKKNGKIIIVVPNYHFYYRIFQEVLYPWLMSSQHNINIMNLTEFTKVFEMFQSQKKIKIEFLKWVEQANLWQLVSKNKFIQKLIYGIHFFFTKIWFYRLLPRDHWSLMVIATVL